MTIDEQNLKTPAGKWRIWAVGFIVWTIIGLSFASRSYFAATRDGATVRWEEILSGYLIDFYIWGAASPFIFWLARRLPIERGRLAVRIPFHFFFSLIFILFITAISLPAYYYLGFPNKTLYPTFDDMFFKLVLNASLLHQGLLIYWGTLIAAHAFAYYRQAQAGKTQAAELASQLAQAQLSALKMQIHPHFLFNTLNSIAALLHKDTEAADLMIARLSDFLRMTLNNSEASVVKLAQELEFLKTYLEIEKIRFQDKLVVEIKIAPDALDAQVPNLILQPLIENAIRHGVAKLTSTGQLLIQAERKVDRLLIKIEDNGPGFSNGNGTKSPRRTSDNSGVGLANTRARLEQFYSNFQFDITDKENGGVIVSLDVPYLN